MVGSEETAFSLPVNVNRIEPLSNGTPFKETWPLTPKRSDLGPHPAVKHTATAEKKNKLQAPQGSPNGESRLTPNGDSDRSVSGYSFTTWPRHNKQA
jgi:hypothetical protein